MRRRNEPNVTLLDLLWDRTAGALTMAIWCSVPCGLLILGLAFGMHGIVVMPLWEEFAWGVGACAALGFLFPRWSFNVLGWLWELILESRNF
jgi:hypothetical protein